jgi:hypothetical protein
MSFMFPLSKFRNPVNSVKTFPYFLPVFFFNRCKRNHS